MKKLIISISFAVLFILSISFIHAENSRFTAGDLFANVKWANHYYLPDDFIATVHGDKILRSLEQIPPAAYCDQERPLQVDFIFLRGVDESIIVENVIYPYVTRFQTHLDAYNHASHFIDSDQGYESFRQTFQWEIVRHQDNYFQVKLKRNNEAEGDFLYIYIDDQTYVIIDIYQYYNGDMVGRIAIDYVDVDGYLLPSRLSVDYIGNNNEWQNLQFQLANHTYGIGLTEDILLNFQNDCANLSEYFYYY